MVQESSGATLSFQHHMQIFEITLNMNETYSTKVKIVTLCWDTASFTTDVYIL